MNANKRSAAGQMQRVDEEELDWDDDVSVLNGVPFNGIGVMYYPDGSAEGESAYVDGFKEGLVKEWHSNGKLRTEWFAERGRAKGKVTEWHPNGTVKSVGTYEFGAELRYEEWDELGNQVEFREIDEASELFEYVVQMRTTA